MRAHAFQRRRRAKPRAHPLLHDRLGGLPQIEIRIELPAEALDLQQGFLQQHQLRLHLIVEASCDLEQAQEEEAERDFLQRSLENRLADRADRRSEEHTSELQSLMRISYAVFCFKNHNT